MKSPRTGVNPSRMIIGDSLPVRSGGHMANKKAGESLRTKNEHMIFGIGIDLIEVDRVAQKMGKDTGFKEFIFSQREMDYCELMTNKFEHYAARFAAKEAFLKAMGTGWSNGLSFNEIEIINNEVGKPEISFLGKTAATIAGFNLLTISVSMSHLKTMATAMVVIEK